MKKSIYKEKKNKKLGPCCEKNIFFCGSGVGKIAPRALYALFCRKAF